MAKKKTKKTCKYHDERPANIVAPNYEETMLHKIQA